MVRFRAAPLPVSCSELVAVSSSMLRIVLLSIALVGCAKGTDGKDPPNPSPTPEVTATPATPEPAAAAPAVDTGFCEYTVDDGPPNRGGGGVRNVQSQHWMPEQGRALASALLINCGAGEQLSLSANGPSIALGPATYKVVRTGEDQAAFGVIGPDFMGGEGELVLSAFDDAHVAGSFDFKAGGKRYKGTFDLKCPQPGSGACKAS